MPTSTYEVKVSQRLPLIIAFSLTASPDPLPFFSHPLSNFKMQKVHSGLAETLSSPLFLSDTLHFSSRSTGDVYKMSESGRPVSLFCCGSPSGLAVDDDGQLFIADVDHRAILLADAESEEAQVVVNMYEDKEFLGPHAICFGKKGSFFFTDSGPFGETNLHNPRGSVYCVANNMLKPIILDSLAYPTGLVLSPDSQLLFVCEMMTNRLLRFVKQAATWHCSVFYQFSGRVGPSSICCAPDGTMYVGHKGVKGDTACVSVLNKAGKLLDEIIVEGSLSVSGVTLDSSSSYLYVTDEEGDVYRIAL
jgi:sugar lactone lactonase YvrE